MKCRANVIEPVMNAATSHTKQDCGSFIHLLSKKGRQSPRHGDDKYFKASFSSRRCRLMAYYLPSTAGWAGPARTTLPICRAAFNWAHLGAGTAALWEAPYMAREMLLVYVADEESSNRLSLRKKNRKNAACSDWFERKWVFRARMSRISCF